MMDLERAGRVVATVYKKDSFVAACKGNYGTGKLKAVQNKEDWCIWAGRAAFGVRTVDGESSDGGAAGATSENRIRDTMMEAHVGLGDSAPGGAAETARVAA
jgi:hypothetical protein